jgi:hypothetical protein
MSSTIKLNIPDDVNFAQLKLARNADGAVSFDWTPIERICTASGIDLAMFREGPEDNVSGLLVAWYRQHIGHGGARDSVQDELIAEAALEEARGGGFSHQPGRG